MYTSRARHQPGLTCRRWLLDPAGCNDQNCKYTHQITGILSPPSSFACYAYNHGGCRLTQDERLFAHLYADPRSQYLHIRHPEMSPSDVPIAEAAARAGFDCSNWPRLRDLINAVRAVQQPVSYPDRWTGPAAFESNVYPDRWRPTSNISQGKTVTQAYRDAERSTSVPAFVVSAQQLINNLNNLPRVQGTPGVPTMMGSGSNRVPLGPVSGNKRGGEENLMQFSSSPKRNKTEPPSSLSRSGFSQEQPIDLTEDEPKPITYAPTRRRENRNASASINNTTSRKSSAKQRREARVNRRIIQDRVTHRDTIGVLAKIASKLRASAHAIDVDRETLRLRWETDSVLQVQRVTDDLSDLNACFTMAEDGIRDALRVIEDRLLV